MVLRVRLGEWVQHKRSRKERDYSLGLTLVKETILDNRKIRKFQIAKEASFTHPSPGPSWGCSSSSALHNSKGQGTRHSVANI